MTEEEDHFALFASWFFLLNWITFFLFSSSKESHWNRHSSSHYSEGNAL